VNFSSDPPPQMTLEISPSAVSVNSRARIADILAKGCWPCRSGVARIVRRQIKSGAETVVIQCVGCGRQLGNAQGRNEHPAWETYAVWDQDLYAKNNPEIENTPDPPSAPETAVSSFLEKHLTRLEREGRCIWRPEVWLEGWTHAENSEMQRQRVDFAVRLDSGPLIGLELKRRPDQAADLGRHCFQAAQYAMARVSKSNAVPEDWHRSSLAAVFLGVDRREISPGVQTHLESAERLYGPARVGFLTYGARIGPFPPDPGLSLWLTGEKWWSERSSYRVNIHRVIRSGNGNLPPERLS
jgi:hypothetical protein